MQYIKLVSLNPDKYESITVNQAITGYTEYLKACSISGKNLRRVKTFNKWLNTEV